MKAIFRFFVFYLTITLVPNVTLAEMLTTYSINSPTTKHIENWVDNNSIVFVVIDDVLTVPDYQMFSRNSGAGDLFLQGLIDKAQKSSEHKKLLAQWYSQRKVRLLEPEWPSFIERVKSKGAKIFGVVEMPIMVTDIEKKRFLELEKLGVKFTEKVNNKSMIVLASQEQWRSVFYHGIIFNAFLSKGQVIGSFLKANNLSPTKIVFFDWNKNECLQVESALKPLNLDFYTLIYLGVDKFVPSVDEDLVNFQQQHFMNSGILLDDTEASKVMNGSSDSRK